MNNGKKPNRLINEKSPYLLQHAYNPVDWYPWGEEAFAKAREEDKPIFLSIGYSTCHWCHVMEHESFEDSTVAAMMNKVFISIKVDREERPDIDNIYMTVCQMLTGSGGWPLTIIMTPDKKPFFAGTYFPKEARFGRIGMIELINRIDNAWKNDRAKINESAENITSAIEDIGETKGDKEISEEVLTSAFNQLNSRYDKQFGGFGTSPKFPSPHNLTFLLRYWKRSGNDEALKMVENTLSHMYNGGMYDHVGFGFHRYSTDREWLVPHFEKMLYDQALLLNAYVETFQATGKEKYSKIAEEVTTY
ncbi:MAG: thioredoxin domain-containing protein, partial [Chlorobi bacterium]|nr:thioredoxin domain-containing protein [Chlorobiota bacterium]